MAGRSSCSRAAALVWAATLCLAVGEQACKRSERSQPPPAASRPAPSADPRRFSAALAGFAERWRGAESLLPNCAPLLPNETERKSCSAAADAVTSLQAALAQNAPDGELIALAATAALSAQRAAQLLRSSGVARLFEERRKGPSPNPSALASARPSPGPAARGAPASLPQALSSALVRSQGSKDLDAISAYSRVATLGLRHLASYLEFGPPALRRSALKEVERLAREEPHWAALRALVNEALLVESDADLKRELRKLREQLG